MIDTTHQISSVQRRLGTRVLEAGEARVLTISQSYDTTIEDLWDACTNPERIPRWFLPVSGDLRTGGNYQFEGNAGGKIERCDAPRGFAATWEYGGQVSWIEVRLTAESGERTRFELEHTAHVDERWEEFGPGAVGIGWDSGLLGLATYLATGESVDPQAAMAWAATEEGRRFMTLSGEGWCEADIAAGADPDQARAASARTIAAYLGESPEAGKPAES